MEDREKRREERRGWVKMMSEHVKPGTIVEYGCGSGLVLEILSARFPASMIVGVDRCRERLAEVVEKNLENVVLVEADISHTIFADGAADSALFVASLHEVYSHLGGQKVDEAFSMAHEVLKEDGILLIQDFLKPFPQPVEIVPRNEQTLQRFLRFSNEFRPREVRYRRERRGLLLDIADAVEFISKYRSPTEEDWNEEMTETHFFFTEEEYVRAAQNAGFTVQASKTLVHSERWWEENREDIEFEFEPRYAWIQLILKKI